MKLLLLASSPYAWKALACGHELGLRAELAVVSNDSSPTRSGPVANRVNLLGKVPVLLRETRLDVVDPAAI